MLKCLSMKSSVSLAFKFFLYLILVTLLICIGGAVIYVIYSECTSLVAGRTGSVFNFSLFIKGLLVFSPVAFVFSIFFGAMYLIRHEERGALPLIFFLITETAFWFAALPGIAVAFNKFDLHAEISNEKNLLSAGYFRNLNGRSFYFADVDERGRADGICLGKAGDSSLFYTFSDVTVPLREKSFSDPIIEDTVKIPFFLSLVTKAFYSFEKAFRSAWENGWIAWISFASIFLSLIAVTAFRRFSFWRMINGVASITYMVLVFAFNILFYSTDLFEKYALLTEKWFSFFPALKNPGLFLVNMSLALIFMVLGFIFYGINKKSLKREGR